MLLAARWVMLTALFAPAPSTDMPQPPPASQSPSTVESPAPPAQLDAPERREDVRPYDVDTRSEASDTAALVGQFVKTMLALGLVIGIIYVLAKVGVARFIPGGVASRTGKTVRVVERVAVDQKNSLVVVEVGASRLLLSSGDRGLALITRIDPDASPASSSFQTVLDAGRVAKEGNHDAT